MSEILAIGETCHNLPESYIDLRQSGRKLMMVTAKGEITFADDLTIDEAKYIIQEIIKWKMN